MAVLEGARSLLQRWRPTVLIEVEERHCAGAAANVSRFLEQCGYSGYLLDGSAMRPQSSFDLPRDQNLSSLSNSGKVSRYINNFIYFDRREAPGRLAAINAALQTNGRTRDSGYTDRPAFE